MVQRTISNNNAKILCLNVSHDGQFIATICEDDIEKKHLVEIYDSGYSKNPDSDKNFGVLSNPTVFTYASSSSKICLQWHPKHNVLAFGGDERGEGMVHLVQPLIQ